MQRLAQLNQKEEELRRQTALKKQAEGRGDEAQRPAAAVGSHAFLFALMDVSAARNAGSMFGSDRLPERENKLSTLASCGKCDAYCLNNV